ncbi:hypothetical protein JMUB6875_03190 [Nocardia sp. JMUB6875]|uniref:hypothetical protein n=1 Tax=Nocardia sp. JMUB6875 TaxID=3158170 RepID=UPI0032E74469
MIIFIALLAGIVIGAIGMAVLDRVGPVIRQPALSRALGRRRPEDTAAARDLDEHAGGSRHIRTNPSWRDRLE